jgi:hypothetical protein
MTAGVPLAGYQRKGSHPPSGHTTLGHMGPVRLLTTVLLCLVGSGLVAPAAGAQAPTDPAAWLYDPGNVVEIDMTLPQTSIDALNADPGEYQNGTLTLTAGGEQYGPFNVGIRLKGSGSFRDLSGKAAFKVKLPRAPDPTFLGLRTLTLNNMVQDRSMIHEGLAYEAFRSAGVAAPRTGYAYVRVNGEDYGVYLNLETIDRVMLPRWFGSTQHLYEGEYDAQGGVDVIPGNAGRFGVDEGDGADLSDLNALIAAVNGDDGDWSDRMAAVADLQQMTRMWAVEKYIGHWDGYSGRRAFNQPNNYFLHSDSSGIFRMLPWGTDQTWTQRLAFDGEAGVMFARCLADASCSSMYRDAVREVRSRIGELDLDARAASTAALLAPWQQKDPRREYSLEDIRTAVEATRGFLKVRPDDAAEWLDLHVSQPPTGTPAVSPPTEKPAVSPTGPAPDLRSPLLGMRTGPRQRALRNRGVIVRIRCDEPCTYRIYGRLDLRRGGHKIALKQRRGQLPANRTTRQRLVLSSLSVRSLRRALRRGARVRARVLARVRDRTGNLTVRSRLVRLTR